MSAKYLLRTDHMDLEVSKRPVPKVDNKGVQKIDRETQLPVYQVELTAFTNEEEGSTVLTVSVPSAMAPDLPWRQPVEVVDLEMIPWANPDDRGGVRSGVAFKAREIRPLMPTYALAPAA